MENQYLNFYKYLTEKALVKDEDFELLKNYFSCTQFSKGHVLINRGSITQHIFFVEKGLLRFYSIDEKGKEHILQFAPENWWLSDRNSLCTNEPSDYYIDAYEDTTVVLLNQNFLLKASEISKEFRAFHESLLHKHINQLYRRINSLISTSAKDRYSEFILTYPNISQRVPQWMIASYLGITPEALSRVRKEIATE
jgi:CRP/FNR family transcriptional regulator, anaerobic regulatory protein